jgi:predicted kinase
MSVTAFNRQRREAAKLAEELQVNTKTIFDAKQMERLTVNDLKDLAKDKNITGYSSMNKKQLIEALSN